MYNGCGQGVIKHTKLEISYVSLSDDFQTTLIQNADIS